MLTEQDVAIPHQALQAWLSRLDGLGLECDGMTRVVAMLLHREGIKHQVAVGSLEVKGQGAIGLHWWVVLSDGGVCDFRARMWLGSAPCVPHGVFVPGIDANYRASAEDAVLGSMDEARKALVFEILTGLSLLSYPVFEHD